MIDLSRLNGWVAVSHFHVETAQSVLQSLRLRDWMVSLDLQDAYLHVPVHPFFSSVPEVLHGRVSLPVPRPLFWPVDGSAGVYTHHGPGLLDYALLRVPDSPLP